MKESFIRKILLIRNLPLFPRGISTSELQHRLEESGLHPHIRTIQRDLQELSISYPIGCAKNLWSKMPGCSTSDFGYMPPEEALTFFLAERFIFELLPEEVATKLEDRFEEARRTINASKKLREITDYVTRNVDL